MPLFKDMPFKQKKSKSLKNELLSKSGVYDGHHRNSFTGIADTPNNTKLLSRSSSHADNEAVLINAVAREDTSAVRRCLEAGKVDVNVVRNGMGPVHHACATGNLNILKLLMRYEADINLRTKEDKTPVKLAVLHGHFEIAEYLIKVGGVDADIVHGIQV